MRLSCDTLLEYAQTRLAPLIGECRSQVGLVEIDPRQSYHKVTDSLGIVRDYEQTTTIYQLGNTWHDQFVLVDVRVPFGERGDVASLWTQHMVQLVEDERWTARGGRSLSATYLRATRAAGTI